MNTSNVLSNDRCAVMSEILLDDAQSSVVTQSRGSVQVCDRAGRVLGQIVPSGVPNGRPDKDRWIDSWNEWYFGIEEVE
jgi:hypothetical protein